MPNQRIAVIGGVASGPAAAAQAKRTDPDAEVVLLEKRSHISYGACEMPYYVADWIEEAETLIVLTPDEFEQTRKAKVQIHREVLAIHPRRNRLDVKNTETGEVREERYDKFILCVGARARMPDGVGCDANNVIPMRRLEQAIAIKQLVDTKSIKHAVILGGGYIGVEMAEALRARHIRVTILEPMPTLLSQYLDEELSPVIHDVVKKHGVAVRQEKAVGFEHDDAGNVSAVRTDKGEKIGCQLVIVAMGVTPNTTLAEAAGVAVGETGALAVDAGMRTNLPNVWACGDCVEVKRVIDGRPVYLPISPVAYRTAHVAGENAARRGRGAPAKFPGVCVASAVKVFELEVAAVGMRLEQAREAGFDAFATTVQHWSRVRIYPGSKPIHLRYVVERRTGRLLGAELVGEEGVAHRADVLVPLIRKGWTVGDIRDLDLIYTPPFAPSLDPLLVAANKAMKEVKR